MFKQIDLTHLNISTEKKKEICILMETFGVHSKLLEESDKKETSSRRPMLLKAVHVGDEYYQIQYGPRGGIYYFTSSGSKIYINQDQIELIPADKVNNHREKHYCKDSRIMALINSEKPNYVMPTTDRVFQTPDMVPAVHVNQEWRIVHMGPQGGQYYYSNRRKVYITKKSHKIEYVDRNRVNVEDDHPQTT